MMAVYIGCVHRCMYKLLKIFSGPNESEIRNAFNNISIMFNIHILQSITKLKFFAFQNRKLHEK